MGQCFASVTQDHGFVFRPVVAIHRVLIEGHFGVETQDFAVGREHQRVDLGEVTVALGEALVELHQNLGRLIDSDWIEFGAHARLASLLE